jgi:hypothetical protein
MDAKKRQRVEHTDDWNQLELLLDWPEQVEYEKIRDAVVFGDSMKRCAEKTGTSESTLRRRANDFDGGRRRKGVYEQVHTRVPRMGFLQTPFAGCSIKLFGAATPLNNV